MGQVQAGRHSYEGKGGVVRRPRTGSLRPETRRILLFAAVAVVFHVFVLPVLGEKLHSLGKASAKVDAVRVVTLSPAAREALRQTQKTLAQHRPVVAVPKPAPVVKAPEPTQKLDGQVVDLPPSPDDRAPDHAKYLSEHNTRVEKETRSRYQSQHYKNAMNEPTTTQRGNVQGPIPPQHAQALEVGPEKAGKDKKAGQGAAAAFEVPSAQQRDKVALRLDPNGSPIANHPASEKVEGNSDRLKLSMAQPTETPSQPGAAPKQGPAAIELFPQLGVLAQISGAPANDHLEDVELGEGTFLNSREFKYASFFNRLKREVSETWRPMDEYRRRDPTRNIYGFRSRLTVLAVTLDAAGKLKDVQVSKSSGLDFLDQAAIAAFQQAQPFPNLPKGLLGPNGDVTFAFGFHIDFGGPGGAGY